VRNRLWPQLAPVEGPEEARPGRKLAGSNRLPAAFTLVASQSDPFPMIAKRFLAASQQQAPAEEGSFSDGSSEGGSPEGAEAGPVMPDGSPEGAEAGPVMPTASQSRQSIAEDGSATDPGLPGANLRSLTPACLSRLAWAMGRWAAHRHDSAEHPESDAASDSAAAAGTADIDQHPKRSKRKSKKSDRAARRSCSPDAAPPSPCLDLLERLGK